jgi:hypothetical protein
MVGAPRFELGTPSPPDWCANRAALRSERSGRPERLSPLAHRRKSGQIREVASSRRAVVPIVATPQSTKLNKTTEIRASTCSTLYKLSNIILKLLRSYQPDGTHIGPARLITPHLGKQALRLCRSELARSTGDRTLLRRSRTLSVGPPPSTSGRLVDGGLRFAAPLAMTNLRRLRLACSPTP